MSDRVGKTPNERMFQNRFKMTSFNNQSRSMSDQTLSDIVFKNQLAFVWTTLYIFDAISMKTRKAWNVQFSSNSISGHCQHLIVEYAYCIVHKHI